MTRSRRPSGAGERVQELEEGNEQRSSTKLRVYPIAPLSGFDRAIVVSILSALAVGLGWYAFGYESRHGIRNGTSPEVQQAASSSIETLNAEVRFTGGSFRVTNHDAFNWTNCRLEVNGGVFRSGYELGVWIVQSHSTYVGNPFRFAKSDGERLDLNRIRPNNMTIACDTPTGRGYFAGGWE